MKNIYFALQYVYLPRINSSLDEFCRQWSHHGIRTLTNLSSLALWNMSLLHIPNETAVFNWDKYGIDHEGQIPEVTTNNVVVAENIIGTFRSDYDYEYDLSAREDWVLAVVNTLVAVVRSQQKCFRNCCEYEVATFCQS